MNDRKNSKRQQHILRQFFSIFLALILIVSSFPVFPTFASSSGSIGGASQEDEDAFAAIGIDTSVIPEGVDLSNNDNPYGKDRVDVIPVYELFEGKVNVDTSDNNRATQTANIFGDRSPMLTTKSNFYENQKREATSANALTVGGYSAFSATSGNFTGSGQKDKIVTVAAGNWNHTPADDGDPLTNEDWISKGAHAGLYLYVTDPVTGATSTVKTILSPQKVIGNIGRYSEEDFVDAPYQLQNYLQVAAGDFDGDGIDEIAVYNPDGGNGVTGSNSRIEVYRLKYTNTAGNQPTDNYLDHTDWELAWSYPFKEGTYVSNMVSLLAGDFNRDGTDDLAITWGVYYSDAYKNTSQAAVLYGSKTSNMLSVAKPFDLKYGASQLVRAAFAYADVNGDNVDELILGAESEDDIKAGVMNTRVINVYAYNGPLDIFTLLSTDNFSLVSYVDDNGTTRTLGDGQYYSSPAMVANITPIRLEGRTKNYMIYLDSVIYAFGDNGLYIYDMMEDALYGGSSALQDATRLNDFDHRTAHQVDMSKYYVEYGAANGDFTGNSLESLHVNQYFLLQEIKSTWGDDWLLYRNRYWWFWGHFFWNFSYFQSEFPHREEGLFKAHAFYANVNSNYEITSLNQKLLHSAVGKLDRYYALLNMDNDTSFMSYTNRHYIRYTDPEVLAVMASAPYFADVEQMEGGDGHVGNSATSFTASDGVGSGATKSDTLSIGTYFAIEHDVEVFGVKVASYEMELAYRHDWTWETSRMSSMTQSITYTSIAGQDSVAFYSIPMEVYEYELKTPIVDENDEVTGYSTQIIALNIPHNASKTVLSLERYEAIAADYPELPQISGTALKHTIGAPSTYPTSSAGYRNPIEFNSLALVGYGLGSVTQEIEMSAETEKAYTNTNAVDFKVGAGVGDFKAGVTVGYEGSRGKVTVSTSGATYSATIVNMPEEASDFQYSYAWKLFTYQYSDGARSFPVVNFIVLDVVEPPKLPQDFDWDSETATNTTVDLTWSYKGNVSAFTIYREYDFSGEKKLVQIATVPASESYGLAEDQLTRLYKYKVTGLSPYQNYGFSIQVNRQVVPVRSARSALIYTRTKTDSGFPDLHLSSNQLLVYPDTPGTVSVDVSYQGQSGETVYNDILYQWQKKVNDTWTNLSALSNYTTKTLRLENSGIATAGEYRCRVDVIYYDQVRGAEYYITAFSAPVTTTYQKRSSSMSAIITNETNLQKPGLSVIVNNPNSGSVKAPLGNVTFVVRGMDYENSYTVALNQVGTTKSSESKILPNIINELPVGIYEITAYYSGDRFFRSNVSEAMMYKSGAETGHWLELSESAQYGDNLVPVLNEVTGQGANSTKTVVSSGITYDVTGYSDWVTGGVIKVGGAGTYDVTATIGSEIVAKKSLIVMPYPLTLRANSVEKVVNTVGVIHPAVSELTMLKTDENSIITSLPNGDTLSGLGLYMKVENTAYKEGTIISHDPELGTDPAGIPTYGELWFYQPGNYTVIAGILNDPSEAVNVARAKALANYQITYEDANYRLISGAYDVVAVPRLLNGQVRGSIEVRDPFEYVEGNQYQSGTQLKFEAVPFEGYQVKAWYVGNSPETLAAALPYEVGDLLHKDNFLNITMRSEAVYDGVEFRVAQYTLVYKPNNIVFGKVENLNSSTLVSGAVFLKGTEYDFKAVAFEGYTFKDWAVTGADTYTTLNNTIKVVGDDKNMIVQANFEREKYKIHLEGDLQAVYFADIDGDSTTPDTKVIALDGDLIPGDSIVTVMAKSGFAVQNWVGIENDTESYTFTMLSETMIEAETAYQGYSVTLSTVQASVMGSEVVVNSDIADFIVGGTAVTFDAKPTYGAIFAGFKINGSDDYYANPVISAPDEPLLLSSDGKRLTIRAIGSHYQVEAVFVDNIPRSLTLNKAARGSLVMQVVNSTYGTINNPVINYDMAAVSTTLTVYEGDELTFAAVPETGFQVIYWKEDKNLIQTVQTAYTPLVISADKAVTVDFGAMGFYTVNYSATGSGTIASASVDGVLFESGNDTIGAGTLIALTSAPDPGFMVEQWTVNGVPVMNDYGHLLVDDTFAFVIGEPSDIQVSFVEILTHDITYVGDHFTGKVVEVDPTEFAIGDSTTGYTSVKDGAYIKMTLSPEAGYYIDQILVNGVLDGFDAHTKEPFIYGTSTGETWTGEIYAVIGDVTVEVIAKPIHTLDLVLGSSQTTFVVTNILPCGATHTAPIITDDLTQFLRDGSKVNMAITPDSGFKITTIDVTGTAGFAVTQATNNSPWLLEISALDMNSTVTVTTENYTPPAPPLPPLPPLPPTPPTPPPAPPVAPVSNVEEDDVPLGISRLEGMTVYEIEPVKRGLVSLVVLTMEEFEMILKEALDHESGRIVISSKSEVLTERLTLTMPKAGLALFLSESDAQLQINFGIANMTISMETLAKILGETDGDNVVLTMSRVNTSHFSAARKAEVGRRPMVNISLSSGSLITNISPSQMTVELPYTLNKGEQPEDVEIYYYDDENVMRRVIGTTYDEASGKLKFDTSIIGDYVIKYDWKSPFRDLNPKEWYYDYVFSAYANGLMNGVSADRFDPSSKATRGMIATMLYNLGGRQETNAPDFSDVPNNAWYASGVAWTVENNIFSGTSSSTFNPNLDITREQLALAIYNYLSTLDITTPATGTLGAFIDKDNVSDDAVLALTWMVENGYMSGKGRGILDPQGFATRAEIAAMFEKLIK